MRHQQWLGDRSEFGLSSDWDSYLCRLGSDLASIYLDLGIAVQAPMGTHPFVAMLSVTMLSPAENGMSTDEEFDALIALEDHLTERLHGDGTIYIGRITTGGRRIFYFYCGEVEAFALDAKAAMEGHANYSYEAGNRADPDWSTYFDFLYPKPDDYRRIRNRRLD